jgi:hypothetical protein
MTAHEHKPCYGTMFPDTLHATNDQRMVGKVFAFRLIRAGGMLRSDRQIEVNQAEWEDCLRCPEFEHCYKLCLAKLTLEAAIASA